VLSEHYPKGPIALVKISGLPCIAMASAVTAVIQAASMPLEMLLSTRSRVYIDHRHRLHEAAHNGQVGDILIVLRSPTTVQWGLCFELAGSFRKEMASVVLDPWRRCDRRMSR
jgi:hypothetical protein